MCAAPVPSRLFRVALLALVVFGPAAAMLPAAPPARSAALAAPIAAVPAASLTLPASRLHDYVMGNRSRMVQITTIAFGIGLVILMTATRKR